MYPLNITSILARITLAQDDNMKQLVTQLSDGKKTAGSPVSIRFRPAVREFVMQASGQLGISSAELVNIVMEGVMRETLTPGQAAVSRIPERFWLLMDEHGLSPSSVVTLLSGWNIGLSILANRERTMDYLTTSVLDQLAEWFGVNREWLEGAAVPPAVVHGFRDWYQAAELLRDRLAGAGHSGKPANTEIIFLRDNLSPDNESNDIQGNTRVGICLAQYKLMNGLPVKIVEYLGQQLVFDTHKNPFTGFMSLCGLLVERNRLTDVQTFTTPAHLLELLYSGAALPVSVLSKIRNLHLNSHDQHYKKFWTARERRPLIAPQEYITDELEFIAGEITDITQPK